MEINKCLVTKLKAAINDSSLPKIDELILDCTPVSSYVINKAALKLSSTADNCIVRIIGDGYFVDDDLVSNPVKQVTLTKDTQTILHCSNGTYKIGISYKSKLTMLSGHYSSSSFTNRVWHLNELSDIKYCISLTYVMVGNNYIVGNIESDLQYLLSLSTFVSDTSGITGSVSKMIENMILNGRTTDMRGSETLIRSDNVTIRDENQEEVSLTTWLNGQRFYATINSPSSYSIFTRDNSKGLDYNLVDGVWVASEHIFD